MNIENLQIAETRRAIPELEYDGTEGYVLEDAGEFVAKAETLEQIQTVAANQYELGDAEWAQSPIVDNWGRIVWNIQ